MQDYLDKLERMIESKKLNDFCVFPDVKPFKIIKKPISEMVKIMRENPDKYADREIVVVRLDTNKSGFKSKGYIFMVSVTNYQIYEDGRINKKHNDSWGISINYMADDLEKHPFKMRNIEKIIKLVNKGDLTSDITGVSYNQFEKKLEYIKKKKEASRIKVKRSIKSSLKKYKKSKSSKKSSKKYTKKN